MSRHYLELYRTSSAPRKSLERERESSERSTKRPKNKSIWYCADWETAAVTELTYICIVHQAKAALINIFRLTDQMTQGILTWLHRYTVQSYCFYQTHFQQNQAVSGHLDLIVIRLERLRDQWSPEDLPITLGSQWNTSYPPPPKMFFQVKRKTWDWLTNRASHCNVDYRGNFSLLTRFHTDMSPTQGEVLRMLQLQQHHPGLCPTSPGSGSPMIYFAWIIASSASFSHGFL